HGAAHVGGRRGECSGVGTGARPGLAQHDPGEPCDRGPVARLADPTGSARLRDPPCSAGQEVVDARIDGSRLGGVAVAAVLGQDPR
ncbi:hypothetical protein MMA48_24400, partial [Salmonella enterica]|nr:hypothetical protein [Salmonella enterica]